MKILKIFGLFGGGFVFGAIAAGLYSGHLFSRMTVSKQVEIAFQSSQTADWLAELRLGETANAIKSMESSMDNGVTAISEWETFRQPDGKTRKSRDGFLINVKVYHESYPVIGDDAASINALLATVPGRSPQSTCKSAVCRLDDLRLANLNTKTNAP